MTEPMLGVRKGSDTESDSDNKPSFGERYIHQDDSLLSVRKAVNYMLFRSKTSGLADEHPYQFAFAVYDPDTDVVLTTQIKCDQTGLDKMHDELYEVFSDENDPGGLPPIDPYTEA